MLQLSNIKKTYQGGVAALDDISLSVGRGVFGLLGPNGAGKSSLMRTLATLQQPDSGTILLDGEDLLADPRAARRRIGYLPQDMGVYPRVSAREMLDYLAALKGLPLRQRRAQVDSLLEQVNLTEVADRRLDTYSGGMRRRFGIAAAFLGAPDLVIVDEPTAGLDPSERRRFQFLLAQAAQSCVLLLSSHIVEDLAGLCNDMALMKNGRLLCHGDPVTLVDGIRGKVWQIETSFQGIAALKSQYRVLSWRPHQGRLMARILADALPGEGFSAAQPDLEDLYSAMVEEAAA